MRHGESWTHAEVERLVNFRAEGVSYTNIALRTGRTYMAIKCKVIALGLENVKPADVMKFWQGYAPGFPKEVKCLLCRKPLTIHSRNDPRRHERCRSSVDEYFLMEGLPL